MKNKHIPPFSATPHDFTKETEASPKQRKKPVNSYCINHTMREGEKKKDKGDFSYFKKWTDAKIPQMQTCSVMKTVLSGHNTTFTPLRHTKSECKHILTKELASSCLTHKKNHRETEKGAAPRRQRQPTEGIKLPSWSSDQTNCILSWLTQKRLQTDQHLLISTSFLKGSSQPLKNNKHILFI